MVGAQGGQEVRLGERDDPRAHSQQAQHVEVLGRLWHRTLVGRHAQDGHVHPECRADHRAQEALVAGHVHHAGRADAGKIQVGVARLQRDPSPLLLRQPVGVDPGERLHQRRLAVVDVPGGADHDSQRAGHSSTHPTPGASLARSKRGSPCRMATGAAQ